MQKIRLLKDADNPANILFYDTDAKVQLGTIYVDVGDKYVGFCTATLERMLRLCDPWHEYQKVPREATKEESEIARGRHNDRTS